MPERFNYQRYLASREWAVLKRQIIARASDGRSCERCAASSDSKIVAAVHHLTYERIGRELPGDLQAVCKGCHEWLSGVSDQDPVVAHFRWEIRVARDWNKHPDPRWHVGEELVAEIEQQLQDWESSVPRPDAVMRWLGDRQAAWEATLEVDSD